jgi:hypothetical protein
MAVTINASTSAGLVQTADTSGVLQLQTNSGTTAVTIDTSQNVGIGTTTVASGRKLQLEASGDTIQRINSGGASSGLSVEFANNGTLRGGIGNGSGNISGGSATTFAVQAVNELVFASGGYSERMRIDSSGNVGIGTTSPGVKLEIHQGAAGSRASLCVHSSASTSTDGIIYSYTNTSSGTGFNHIAAQSLGSVVFKVLGNGNVQNANNSYGSTSDIKLKENIVDATPKLDDLMKVKVRHYNFIDDELKAKQIGVVAQEVEQVFSGIVEDIPDRDEEGNTLDSVTKSVKYSVFVPMLIKAIQEQQTIINDLKARITALEGAA